MSRPTRGKELLTKASEALRKAHTTVELRKAQSVILPLGYGFTLKQAAAILGISRGWACQLRTQFIKAGETIRRRKHKEAAGKYA
jgi:hypothetical protein